MSPFYSEYFLIKCWRVLLSLSLHNNRTVQCLQLFGSSCFVLFFSKDMAWGHEMVDLSHSNSKSPKVVKSISKLYKSHLHLIENRTPENKYWNYTVWKKERERKANGQTNASCQTGGVGVVYLALEVGGVCVRVDGCHELLSSSSSAQLLFNVPTASFTQW